MPPTRQLGLRIANDAAEWLETRARTEERSLAYVVTRLIRQEMAREAKAKKAKAAPTKG